MTATTWAGVHAGDTVRGADQRAWVVLERHVGPAWVLGGAHGRFVLAADGRKPVSIMRKLDEPCPLVSRADHSEEARAAGALLAGGLTFTLIGEEPMTQPIGDPFTPPAPAQRGGSTRPEPPTGQWGWYKLTHPVTGEEGKLWPRVSTIVKALADDQGLERWKLRMVAKGVAQSPDLIAKAIALNPEIDKRDFADIVDAAMERAKSGAGANYGSAVHRFAERVDAGETVEAMGVPDPLAADVRAYGVALKAAGLQVIPELSERLVINAELEYGGRWDRVVRDVRTGDLHILDLKTGKNITEYGDLEISMQEAFYGNATHLTTVDYKGYEPMPPVNRQKAFVLHLPIGSGRGEVLGIDIAEGWYDARLALTVRARRSAAKKGRMWSYSPGTPADAVWVRIGRAATTEELGVSVKDAKRINAWTPELEAYALARYDMIRVCDASSRADLATLWAELHPAGRWTDDLNEAAQRRAAQLTEGTTTP